MYYLSPGRIMVISTENGLGRLKLNPGQGYLHSLCATAFGKYINLSLLSFTSYE